MPGRLFLNTLWLCWLPIGLIGQEVEILFLERSQAIYQDSGGSYLPMLETGWDDWYNYAFYGGAVSGSGTISNFMLRKPGNQAAESIPPASVDGEYEYIRYFSTVQQMAGSLPSGNYMFSGTGSTVGNFNEAISLGAFESLAPKLVLNYDELQAFDPGQEMIIQLTPFDDRNGKTGFITVNIEYWDGNQTVEVWNSESVTPDGVFGLDGSTTSIVLPKGTAWNSPDQTYTVQLYYSRLDFETSPASFPDALLVAATSQEVVVSISEYVESPWSSPWWDLENYDGWYTGWIGWFQELYPPSAQYLYHLNMGSVYYTGSQESLWLYLFSGDMGWMWTGKALYPHMYSWNRGWVYHLKGSDWFYDLQLQQWFELTP